MENTASDKKPKPFAVVLSEEEFQEYNAKLKRDKLISDMMSAANKPFSVKGISKKKEKQENAKEVAPKITGTGSLHSGEDLLRPSSLVDDIDWNSIMNMSSEFVPSPIAEVTNSEMGTFHLEDSEIEPKDAYDRLFKKELAMLAELLQDTTDQAKSANTKIKDMTKKSAGYGGVSKTFSDLLSAANALNNTRRSIVMDMAKLKKDAEDLKYRKSKDSPEATTSNDDIADNFFNKIINNRKGFIDSAMAMSMHGNPPDPTEVYPFEYEPKTPVERSDTPQQYIADDIDDDSNERYRPSLSITSPLAGYTDTYEDFRESESDPYGYIRNEDKEVNICVQRFSDGRVEFVAIDKDGDGVEGYELPDEDLLATLQFRFGSQFASDAEGRRYRIIDVSSDGVDISDILEEE